MRRLFERGSGTLETVGALALVTVMVLTAIEVIGRNVAGFRVPPGAYETSELLMVVIFALPLAGAAIRRMHVSISFFHDWVHGRSAVAGRVVHGIGLVFTLVVCVWLLYTSVGAVIDSWASGERRSRPDTGLWWWRAFIPLGVGVMTLYYAIEMWKLVKRDTGPDYALRPVDTEPEA